MKSINFNRASWHAWFIDTTTDYFKDRINAAERNGKWEGDGDAAIWVSDVVSYDICSYTRAFLAGVFKTIVVGALLFCLGSVLLSGLIYPLLWLFNHHVKIPPYAAAGFILWVVGLGAAICKLIYDWNDARKNARPKVEKPPSVLKTMFKHWHDKTCAKIEFNADEQE